MGCSVARAKAPIESWQGDELGAKGGGFETVVSEIDRVGLRQGYVGLGGALEWCRTRQECGSDAACMQQGVGVLGGQEHGVLAKKGRIR